MAVAGLQNVSALESSILGENHSLLSRRWENKARSTTRTSSIRKMWQQRSDVSNDNFENSFWSKEGSINIEDNLGDGNEVENERLTCLKSQIGPKNGHADERNSCLQMSPAFGVAERERVRQVFREWGNSCLGEHTSYVSHVNSYSRSELLGENEHRRVRIVREWIEMTTQQKDPCCSGREAKAAEIGLQIERVRDGLVVDHSEIGARRAIRSLCGRQALLDLVTRFAWERKRELQGLLENRPVSNFAHRNRIQALLRGRFLQNRRFVHDERPTSLAASELGLLRQSHTVSDLRKGFLSRLDSYVHSPPRSAQSDSSSNSDINYHSNEQTQEEILQEAPDEISDEFEASNGETDIGRFHTAELEAHKCEALHRQESTITVGESHERILENEEREQLVSVAEFIEMRDCDGEDAPENWQESNGNEWSRRTLGFEYRSQGTLPKVNEIMDDNSESEPSGRGRELLEASDHNDSSEINALEDLNWQEGFVQVEDWQESITENDGWYPLTAESDLQELNEEWNQNDLEENAENWLDGTSWLDVAPIGRITTLYSSDDDTGRSMELRELTSRRRVSNLLQSSFREHLNQLLKSYVERQGHASDEDENTVDSEAVERTELIIPSVLEVTPQTLLHQDLHDAPDWQHPDIHQPLGIEWDIINDLRNDMARLQQRMNNLQRMLEICMDMQLELKRSVLQELSAALNRSSNSTVACEDSLLKEIHVRKGVCCICCDSNVDSLLYRCGRIHTLVQNVQRRETGQS